MQNIKQKLKIIRKKPIVKQLKNDENGLFSLIYIHLIFDSFIFSLKRKGNPKTKKNTNTQNSNKSDENTSSSSDNEDEGTNSSDVPVANTEENQPAKEPTPPPLSPVQQQHEKSDIRKHLRHRKADSSDEEENGPSN